MNEIANKIADHYGRSARVEHLLAALEKAGTPVDRLTPEALYPFDQLHARQIQGTREHLASLGLKAGDRLLDVGCGIGGPTRYAAATFGCHVTGIDLTEEFIGLARDLTARCGLSGLADFHQGNALAMPFEDASFDAASCYYVAMNIADKAGLVAEIARLLKPGGRLAWGQVVLASGEPAYPLPWARDPSASFLVTEGALRAVFDASGLSVVEWRDETDTIRASAAKARAAGAQPDAGNAILLGEDFAERRRNFGAAFQDGRLRSIAVLAKR